MKRYQEAGDDDPRPAVIDKYEIRKGTFIYRLKNADREGQGRLLFYPFHETERNDLGEEIELLIDLLVYKKEGQDVPGRHLKTATVRMQDHRRQTL